MYNLKRKILSLKPVKRIIRQQKLKRLKNQAVNITFGEQDQLDLMSYSGLKEESSYLQLNDSFVRTLFVSGYPYVASTGWLSMLVNFNHNIDISYHIEQIDPLIALPKLNRKITELESTKRTMLKEGRVIGSEITDPLESAMELRDKIQRGQEKLFQVSIYMTITADSLSELNKITKMLETVMQTRLFYIKTATFQQIEGLQSILPRSENKLSQKRNLDSSSAALTFPFVSSELVQESGILYGINKSNSSLVIIDRYSLNNANSIIFAQSGSGKSYTAKVEILRHLMQGTKVIVIDPEREYKQLAKSVNGTYIKLSVNSKEKINPFAYTLNSITEENNLPEQIQDLTELISLMVGSLTSEERAIVDKALLATYKTFGLNSRKNGKVPKTILYPTLKDFYKELKALKQKDLCDRLERFVKGSLEEVFNAQTNIELNNRLVVFDIKDLNESLRSIMMMVVANFVNNEVKQNPQKRMLVIDEGWMLLQEPESARFVSNLVRRARKYYLGVTIISQQANDFLSLDYGKAIASQSSLRVLMRQDTTTIKKVAEEFHLSDYEQHYLLTCDRGEAIVIADQNHVAVKVVASEEEHPLLTTDPREIYI
ncbi:MAG: Type IV secretory pathway VirB4 component-like protein [candidate division WWE3 bacterium GW2011_GWE1_41_27]|uniref:Type IV secretory pathway VirB4 component-like protein n=1 Tax=candidate division WWE3 bacterium GW2011_GWE1_41_27 TaxID=1619131 RepID=A0A0G0VYW1_UNCKA|nr:MAG: Type IV secretory pathway VirB4 component-like protein [candidate division WWE3 bacterium GW2011_GWE1_41_27]